MQSRVPNAWPQGRGPAVPLTSSPAQFQEVFFGWKLLRMKERWGEKAARDKAEPASPVGG